MTYIRPDKKGLGLDVPGPDEPSHLPGRADSGPRHWWLTGRSLAGSIAFSALWTGYAVLRLVYIVTKPEVSAMDWLMLALPSSLALVSVPSIVFFARSRQGRATATPRSGTSA